MRKGILAVLALLFSLPGTTKTQGEEYRFNPPVNLGPPLNTEASEVDPYVTADGQRLFFVRIVGGNADIYMSIWNGTDWSEPVNLGPNVNSGLHEWSPSVSPDGNKLYFTAFGRPGSFGGWDIWYSEWDSIQQEWGPAQNLGPAINTPAIDWTSKVSYDGQSLYYMSNGKGHIQGSALYVSRWNGSSWNNPVALPDNINNTATEEYPSLTLDENTMYFVRWYDHPSIYATQKNFDGTWNNPVQLDSVVNGFNFYGSSGPCVTPNGRTLYFASARPDGFGQADIWVAERIIPIIFGDLNQDGQITIADVVLELNKVFLDEPFPAAPEFGDLNCDSLFAPSDVVLLLNRAFLGSSFPCNI